MMIFLTLLLSRRTSSSICSSWTTSPNSARKSKLSHPRGLKPLAACYFGIQTNPQEQFMYFVSLTQWLLEICGSSNSGWNQYDDPGTVTNNIVLDLKNLGIPLNYPATKLKPGSGEAVVQVLLELGKLALQGNKFKFRAPVIPDDDADEGDDEEDDMEGQADLADMMQQDFSEEEDIAELVEEEEVQEKDED